MDTSEAFDLGYASDNFLDLSAESTADYFNHQIPFSVGSEVGIRAWPDELDFELTTVIYRLLEVDGETAYSGPFMIDAEGIVRIAEDLSKQNSASYSFVIEALASDGTSCQSDVQTLFV